MKIEVIKFKREHALYILNNNVRKHDAFDGDYDEYLKIYEDNPAYTIVINDEIVFCGGVVDIGWRRGEAWTLMSDLFYKYPKTCFKICKEKLNELQISMGLRRLQALVDTNLEGGSHFAQHLGFEYEGLLKAYGPNGESMLIFGRTELCNM